MSSTAKPAPVPATEPKKESLRDTMESVVFAFILAFLFRTFEAEAFVIPTGSMAPTLYGRHKEADCPKCGAKIIVGASDEYDADLGVLKANTRLTAALCPNCRYENTEFRDALAFNGDRILVNKFPYEIGEPHRWDVFVFKYPEQPDMNYIKRLVGLPGETIRIRQGDVYRWDGTNEEILRKSDPTKQRALQMMVYDDAYPAQELLEAGWPERWAAVTPSAGGVGGWVPTDKTWVHSSENRTFRLEKSQANDLNWVRYRHYVPHPRDWEDLGEGRKLEPQAQLIGDFCGYNATIGTGYSADAHTVDQIDMGMFWVGDLTIDCTLVVEDSDGGEVVLEIGEGVYRYRCRINLTDGSAGLFEIKDALTPDEERPLATASTSMNGPGTYALTFTNVDDRLCLWINDKLVDFGEKALLPPRGATNLSVPVDRDLSPVGIAVKGASAELKDLKLKRDVYYRSEAGPPDGLWERMANPREWGRYYLDYAEADQQEIQVDPDGFLALGDNSPRSRDSRMWKEGMQSVPRRHLVGRAFYIYWPHGVPFLNDGRGFSVWSHKERVDSGNKQEPVRVRTVDDYPKWTVPFYPQVDRMKRIR